MSDTMQRFYELNPKAIWKHFWSEHPSFWMICGYLFIEYVRPQSLYPALNIIPWAELFLGLAFLCALFDRSVKWVSSPTNKWVIFFALCILIASVLASYPEVSAAHLIDFFQWFFIYFLIVNIVNSKKRLYIFLLLFMVASFKISLSLARLWATRGFSFTKWGLVGPPGFFENSGELAIQMLMFLPISYYFVQAIKPHLSKLKLGVLIVMPITAAMTIMGSSSRGGQIGLIFQIYYLFLKKRLSVRTILLAIVVIVVSYTLIPEEQKVRLGSIGRDSTSVQRLLYWKHGVEMIETHPLLGVGYFNFAPYYTAHFPQDTFGGQAELPHNIFIQIGTDAGLLGILAYLALIYRGFRTPAEIKSLSKTLTDDKSFYWNMSQGLLAALWGFLIAGQFVTVGYYPFMWINLSLTVALRNILEKDLSPQGNGYAPIRKGSY